MTGEAEINFWGHEKFIYVNSRGARGTRNLIQCGSSEQAKDKKKVFSSKFSTNSGYRRAIFYEFLSEDHKKRRSSSQKFYKIRYESTKNYENTSGKHQFGSLRPRFALL